MGPPNGAPNGLPPPMQRTDTGMTGGSAASFASTQPASASAIKIKVFLAENIIMLRLPPTFTYADLVSKVRERWRLEPDVVKSGTENADFSIDFRSEAQAQYFRLTSEEDLERQRATGEKLIVRVRTKVSNEV